MWRWQKICLAMVIGSLASTASTPASFARMLPKPNECALLQESETSLLPPSTPSPIANTARDPEIAVCEEFEIAAQQGTLEAYRLFIARHPDHELAKLAKALMNKIQFGPS